MNASPARPVSLADLLAFYREAGVDEAVEETAVDRFAVTDRPASRPAEIEPPRSQPAAPPPARQPAALAVPDESQAVRARELARSAASLDELRDILAGFDGCNLKFTAKNLVFADGNPDGGIMFVGEAPGRDEDIEGLPFVGVSGQLLDRMLAAIGLDRSKAYIANVIPWRPPGNRTPTPLETEICRPFIERQIELANPKILVTLGNPSTKLLLAPKDGILRVRGTWREYTTAGGTVIPAMPTLHPAYLLRNPAHKKLAWRDFLEIKARLAAALGDL
ncbi:MAG: uracil-DNA glycosylase [Rhizobiaceae bacterium]|nr:uracil-DNA glycosylase [Rhizobiaceae bacterium]MCV0405434.1 uracil-DNA glycosylase [Rhizobiaceae bacterium]